MATTTANPKATRTVKIGDNHHRLLRILSQFLKLSMQETFEVAVEQTLNSYMTGLEVPTKPLDWSLLQRDHPDGPRWQTGPDATTPAEVVA